MEQKSTLFPGMDFRQRGAVPTLPVISGLEPYSGSWELPQATHLLRRATFGPTYAQMKTAQEMGLNATIGQLFQSSPLPAPPVNYDFDGDPNVPIGETWIQAPYVLGANLRPYRNRSLRAWTMGQIIEEGVSIREKLTLFWHNHFAVSNVNDPKFLYRHITLLRENAWGNFKQLIKDITIDPAILRFLNGNQNTAQAPNENFARELLELYTIGKGELAGPGDYTTFTEADVIQMARVLTGWVDRGFNSNNPDLAVSSIFLPARHDTGAKQLSHRFGEAGITDQGADEYAYLVDLIFQQDEVARFISRKLYRWFVYYAIDDAAEANVIEPMAQLLIANNFEIRPALEALLGSAHFYDMLNVGPMIKNPIDFLASAIKPFSVGYPPELERRYLAWLRQSNLTGPMQMTYYAPPDVAGWKAYYQEPLYYRTWINASTLPPRMAMTEQLTGNGYFYQGFRFRIDPLAFIATIDNPLDPNAVITEFARILLPMPLTQNQLDGLKEILIPGLPDFEWTLEYGEYAADPDNSDLAEAIESKLRNLLGVLLSLPEFYLS